VTARSNRVPAMFRKVSSSLPVFEYWDTTGEATVPFVFCPVVIALELDQLATLRGIHHRV
jgi:hypothetical protein